MKNKLILGIGVLSFATALSGCSSSNSNTDTNPETIAKNTVESPIEDHTLMNTNEGFAIALGRGGLSSNSNTNRTTTTEVITEAPTTPEPTTESPPPPPTTPVYQTYYCHASEYATLRVAPNTSSAELDKVHSGDAVDFISVSEDFYYVRYNGIEGYVLSKFFSEDKYAPVIYEGRIYYYCRASEYVTLRAAPNTSSAELDKIYTGSPVVFLDVSGSFYHVNYNGKDGYVLSKFFSKDQNAPLVYDSV